MACYKFRKEIPPTCDSQKDCKWVVGVGCIPIPDEERTTLTQESSSDETDTESIVSPRPTISRFGPSVKSFTGFHKQFDKEDVEDNHCGKQLYPKNIIVYGGFIHMNIMSELIKDIFKTEPSIIKQVDPKVGCLEFEDPIQFF